MSSTRTLLAFLVAGSALSALPVAGQTQGLRRRPPAKRFFGEVHRMLPRAQDNAVALADLDDDGDLDAVMGSRLYLNDGTGLLVEAPDNLPAAPTGTASLAVGDVDGDGDPDILMGKRGRDELYLNDGTGVFSDASANLPSIVGKTSAVVLGDLDGDGDLDAFLASWSVRGGVDRVYLNDGSGVFTFGQFNLPIGVGGSLSVALGDVDGDGDLDALTGDQERFMHDVFGQQNRLYLNNGSGFFVDSTFSLPGVFDPTYVVALEDLDGDGDLDALIGNGGNIGAGGQSALWRNNGAGRFTVATNQLPQDSDFTHALAFGDVEGDGDVDILIGNNGQNRLYLNDGAGVFTDASGDLPVEAESTRSAALGDLDGDGDLDVLMATIGIQNRLYLNDGQGAFVNATDAPRMPLAEDRTSDLAAGDVDGDGDLDVLSVSRVRNRLYLNDGQGVFDEAELSLPQAPRATSAVDLADVDADGDLDALTGSATRAEHLLLNDGAGVFTDHSAQLPAIANAAATVAFGDLDGDGLPDAVVGSRLYLNDGTGTFADAAGNLPAGLGSASDSTLGDVDGDGSLDIVLAGEDHHLLLNDGSGVFHDATADLPRVTQGKVNAVALGDVEQDGDLDLVLGLNRFVGAGNAGASGGQVLGPFGRDHLFLNGGTGVFADATDMLPDTTELVTAVVLADVDGDGDLDAVLGAVGKASSSEQNRLYLNDGAGGFTDATARHLEAVSNRTQAVLLRDFDADGDADLWFGNDGLDRIYTNLSHQLAWRTLPRVGQPLALDLHGPAFSKWLLATSLDTGLTNHPPHGVFQLDPATFQAAGQGAFKADGRATLTTLLPPELDVMGLTLYWQACFLDRPVFSNLEATTLTGF